MAVARPVRPVDEDINIGDVSIYVTGGGLPEGDYIFKSLDVVLFQAETKAGVKKGPVRLGVQVTVVPLQDPHNAKEERSQFYSMGSKAHLSFAPNDAGKGLRRIPDGAGGSLTASSNWMLLVNSMYDCGLPSGVFTNDTSVLEGMHVHIQHIPEPEERKGFRSNNETADNAGEFENQGPRTIPVVGEIKDDGKPWEGTGGIPDSPGPKAVAKPKVATISPKVAAKPKAVPEPEPEPEPEPGEVDLLALATSTINTTLAKNPKGCRRVLLSTSTFRAVKESAGEDVAQQVIEEYFSNDEKLSGILAEIVNKSAPGGYMIKGTDVVPA